MCDEVISLVGVRKQLAVSVGHICALSLGVDRKPRFPWCPVEPCGTRRSLKNALVNSTWINYSYALRSELNQNS